MNCIWDHNHEITKVAVEAGFIEYKFDFPIYQFLPTP
jgi:hypothetical protein